MRGLKSRLTDLSAIILFSALCFIPKHSLAEESQTLFINEAMWKGSSVSSSDEWIELYNQSNEEVNLGGYYIFDEVKQEKIAELSDDLLVPNEVYLISNNSMDHVFARGESILDVAPDLISSRMSLNNNALKITLRDPLGNIIDTLGNGNAVFLKDFNKTETYHSLQRINYGEYPGDYPGSWRLSDESINLDDSSEAINLATPRSLVDEKIANFELDDNFFKLGTSKQIKFFYDFSDINPKDLEIKLTAKTDKTIFEKMVPRNEGKIALPVSCQCWNLEINFASNGYKRVINEALNCFAPNTKIKFSEILSAPKGKDWNKDGVPDSKDEWFEIINLSGVRTDLTGWRVVDGSGKEAGLARFVEPGGYIVFHTKDLSISLNNSAEKLSLIDPSGTLVDQVLIPALAYNQSYSQINGVWKKVVMATPGAINKDDGLVKKVETQEKVDEELQGTDSSIEEVSVSQESPQQVVEVRQRIVKTKIPQTLATFNKVERKNLSVLDGGKVLSGQSERKIYPFNFRENLIYLISVFAVVAIAVIIGVSLHEIYRRE